MNPKSNKLPVKPLPLLQKSRWPARTVFFAVLLTLAATAAAADRTVKLSVSVVGPKKEDVSGATVTVSSGVGSPVTIKSDANGTATTDISIGAGGWLGSDAVLSIQATKDGMSGSQSLNVRGKEFKNRNTIEMAGTVALNPAAAELTSTDKVRLIVKVVDVNGNAAGGATVTVTRDTWGPEMRPFDHRIDADGAGIATIDLSLGAASWLEGRIYWPVFEVEATLGKLTATKSVKIVGKRLATGMTYPTEVNEKLVIKGSGINVAVLVMGNDDKPVDGANVLIRDSTAGGMGGGRFRGLTGADGRVTIPVAFFESSLQIEVTREGYESGGAGIVLQASQVGKTIAAPQITLKKGPKVEAVDVTVKVTKEGGSLPVPDAAITFTGISGSATGVYTATTDTSGQAPLRIPGYGTFNVTLIQDTFEKLERQVQIGYGEEKKTFEFSMTEKPTGDDSVTITVLAGDVKNGRGGFQPIKGATVKAGKLSMGTDGSGTATLDVKSGIMETGKGEGYTEAVSITVSAEGYKSQTRSVSIKRSGKNMAGSSAATFTLEAGEDPLSETTPLKLVVEVRDAAGPVDGANVDFLLPDGTWLFSFPTKNGGRVEFLDSDGVARDQGVSNLRKGLRVKVQKKGYKEYDGLVADTLLKPAKENKYSVQLDKDWDELAKALAEIEGRLGALRNEVRVQVTKEQSVKQLAANAIAARGRIESSLNELKAARKAFDTKLSGTKCEQAKELLKSIETLQKEAAEKEKALRKLLDEASGLVANCTTKAEGAAAAEKYRNAIKLAGEMNGIAPKATQANEKLTRFAEAMKEAGPLQAQLQEIASKIQNEVETARKESSTATSNFNDAFVANRELPGKHAALESDYAKLKASFQLAKDYSHLPKELAARLEKLDQALGAGGGDPSLHGAAAPDLSRIDEVIKPALAQIEQSKAEADTIVAEFKGAMCTVQPMDTVVQELASLTTGNMIEIASVADITVRAQACGTSASPTPTPTPSPSLGDEVIVPDVSIFKTPSAMKAAAAPGLVGQIIAINARPPPGTISPFASQDPPALSKAKRGSPLKIFVYQSMLQAATPTPTLSPAPTAALTPSPSPSATEDEMVVVPPVKGAESIDYARTILNQAGFKSAFKALKPKSKEDELKIADSAPAAGEKAKRGSTVVVFIYQKFEGATADTSPVPTAPPLGPARGDTVPNLIGLTLEQASARLTSNMRIGGDEVGDKPPKPELALTIFAQTPPANSKVEAGKNIVFTVKRYGSAKTDEGSTAASATTSDNPLGGVFKGQVAAWRGKVTRFDGGNAGEWTVQVRKGKDGRLAYFVNSEPLDEVQVQGGKVIAKQASDRWINGYPEILRGVFRVTLEPTSGGKVIFTMTEHTIMRAGGEKKEPILRAELAPDAGGSAIGMLQFYTDEVIEKMMQQARKQNKEHEESNARSKGSK